MHTSKANKTKGEAKMTAPAKELRIKIQENSLDNCFEVDTLNWTEFKPEYVEHLGKAINRRNKDGLTALHMAARSNQNEVTSELIKNGAFVNARSKHGYTPLHIVANYLASSAVAKILIDNGALVNAIDDDGNTPLHFAIIRDSQLLVKLLLKNGANVLLKNENGKTAMELGKENKDFHLSDAYWLLNDATYNQKDSPKKE